MSTNLQKIKSMAASVRETLASLKPSSAMDDLDNIARERAILREKLDLLTDAEADELQRLEDAEREAQAKKRRAKLLEFAKQMDSMTARHRKLTEKANGLMIELAGALIERERILDRDAVGLDDLDVLTPEERSTLQEMYLRSHMVLSTAQLGNCWRYAVSANCEGIERARFNNLIPGNGPSQGSQLPAVQPLLPDTAKAMANS